MGRASTVLIFQYGSNISTARLNARERLDGDATVISIVSTVHKFDIAFTVWSNSNGCAAADIVQSDTGRRIYGVLYEIPDYLIDRESARAVNRRSLDAIEGAGRNYERTEISVVLPDGTEKTAITYVVRKRSTSLHTSKDYAQHIVDGLHEHKLPEEYRHYVVSKIEENNPSLVGVFNA